MLVEEHPIYIPYSPSDSMRNGGPLVVSLRRKLTVGSMVAVELLDLVVAGGVGCSATSWVRAIEGTSGVGVVLY